MEAVRRSCLEKQNPALERAQILRPRRTLKFFDLVLTKLSVRRVSLICPCRLSTSESGLSAFGCFSLSERRSTFKARRSTTSQQVPTVPRVRSCRRLFNDPDAEQRRSEKIQLELSSPIYKSGAKVVLVLLI